MNNFDIINGEEGKEYLILDSSELYDDSLLGNSSSDYEILKILGEGKFGKVFKVRCKKNNKIYAMKMVNIMELRKTNEKAYILALKEQTFLEGLKNPHIIKYYKNFIEGPYLYIIFEYSSNGDMSKFINTNKTLDKNIPEEKIWNIFLQCMNGLSYAHSMKVIHRDIKLTNILMDNNMSIKLGGFHSSSLKNKAQNLKNNERMEIQKTCLIIDNYFHQNEKYNNYLEQRNDVYSMGISFYEICYFHMPPKIGRFQIEKFQYSNELKEIINLMLDEDKNKRKSSQEIYNMLKNEYSKKYTKNTSIDAIVRCLYSFSNLTQNLLKSQFNHNIGHPITQNYIQCLKAVTAFTLDSWINSINSFRQILGEENTKIEGNKEIDPSYIYAFLIRELHKELNISQYSGCKKDRHFIISREEEAKINKNKMMFKFLKNMSELNSIISDNFLGLMKVTYFCHVCKIKTFSFSSYFLVTFDLEKILEQNNIQILRIEEQFANQNIMKYRTKKICDKCFNKTSHTFFKQFYSLPNCLVISIQRGISFNYKTPVDLQLNLDLSKYVEYRLSPKIFWLVGFLGRVVRNGNESYFSVVYSENKWFKCEGRNIKAVNSPLYYNYNNDGHILMLFYQTLN